MTESQIAILVTAAAALMTSIVNSMKANRITKNTEIIHELVNSNLTKIKKELSDAQVTITELKKTVAELQAVIWDR